MRYMREGSPLTDDWETPDWLMALINEAYHPTMDPCPIDGSHGLDIPWTGTVYCNPPYSDIEPWIRKALESDCRTIFLLPVRTSTLWWDLIKDYKILWIPRIRFKGAPSYHREYFALIDIRRDRP